MWDVEKLVPQLVFTLLPFAHRALWSGQWQMVCRAKDLLRRAARGSAPWDARWDSHRGRVLFSPVPGSRTFRMTILLPPGKTDPPGERCLRKSAVAELTQVPFPAPWPWRLC